MSVTLKLTDAEGLELAEMLTLAATVAGTNQKDSAKGRLNKWGAIMSRLMAELAANPKLKGKLEFSEEARGFVLSPGYAEKAFYYDCIDEFRDFMFWEELVMRMADKAIVEHMGADFLENLSEEERRRISEPLEKSLWQEVTKYGVDRLGFILPPIEG